VSQQGEIYSQDVVDILDLYYDRDGHEPDWAAIRTRLHSIQGSYFTVMVGLMRALWAIYEVNDPAAAETIIFHMQEEVSSP
jgi:hypothetical protein